MPGPFEAWLQQCCMRTPFLRVRRALQTALELATHFAGHPAPALYSILGCPIIRVTGSQPGDRDRERAFLRCRLPACRRALMQP